ncbi:MAG: molybdopterin-dependent oxidoreductase, partial [Deferribacterales bacterium]|nr:molybdopterin-dependent oxidoreductase [Deferribacterales bacterium]
GTGDYMQDRACPRCRSQKSWIYGSNRLLYPMIQTKKRGDLDGFRRVTWEQAAQYFKAKAEKVAKEYGPGAFHNLYASGMGGGYSPNLFNMVGATSGTMLKSHDDYSFPQWELITRCMHDANSQPRSNDFQDVYNSDELVIWCYNLSEMLNQQQINFTLTQVHEIFKAEGKKITVVDPKFTNTAILGADKFIPTMQGTDAAMICGMIHYLLTEKLNELALMYAEHASLTDGERDILSDPSHADFVKTFRQAVGRYVYGFFDTNAEDEAAGTNDSYNLTGDDQTTFKAKAAVAPGASFSAYIFGSSDVLVTKGLNLGTSVYPEQIGYNVRSYAIDGEYDPLWDTASGRSKLTSCYGQVEKTPQWAEKICGVPAADIKALADTFLTKNVSCWMMGGLQRNSEGDQGCWAWTILMNFMLCFGKPGRSHGRADGRGNDQRQSVSLGWSTGIKNNETNAKLQALADPTKVAPYLNSAKTAWEKPLGDMSLLTFPNNYNSNHSYDSISVFTWLDAADASNRPKIDETRWTMNGNVAEQVTESFYP